MNVLFESLLTGIFLKLFEHNKDEMLRFLSKYVQTSFEIPKEMVSHISVGLKEELRAKLKYWSENYFTRFRNLVTKGTTGKITLGKMLKSLAVLGQGLVKGVPGGIARNIIGKLNSKIMGSIQTAFGFEEYVWETVGDELVRGDPTGPYSKANPSHFVMNGLIGTWSDATVFKDDNGAWQTKYGKMERAHPGEADGCRCTAVPNMATLLDKIIRRN